MVDIGGMTSPIIRRKKRRRHADNSRRLVNTAAFVDTH
jgi:hypothetical protein